MSAEHRDLSVPLTGTDGLPTRLTGRLVRGRRIVPARLAVPTPRVPPRSRLLVLVVAHDDERTVGRTLESLLAQTRRPDRIVLLADECTDRTELVARRARGVTVMRTVGNTDGAAGALNQGWRRWQAGADLVAGVEAGTVPDPDCLQRLEDELAGRRELGSVFTEPVPSPRASVPARAVLHLARAVRRAPRTGSQRASAVGGRVVLFHAGVLRTVTDANQTPGPWDTSAHLVHVRLTTDLWDIGRPTAVSPVARARSAARVTLRSLAGVGRPRAR